MLPAVESGVFCFFEIKIFKKFKNNKKSLDGQAKMKGKR